MKRDKLVHILNETLNLNMFPDDSSNNGLQIEGAEDVEKIVFVVDASLSAAVAARAGNAQMVIAHHGLSWGGEPKRLTGVTARRYREFFIANTSLYAAHLPLDAHFELGNNANLAKLAGITGYEMFCFYHGGSIGCVGELKSAETPAFLAGKIAAGMATAAKIQLFGAELERPVRKIGFVSGGGGAMAINAAISANCDALVTGEVIHQDYSYIIESGLSVIALGHYASETLGVISLMEYLRKNFAVPGEFIDLPTNL